MGWVLVGVAAYLVTLYLQSRYKAGVEPGKIEAPTATEGIAIPVLFGERAITSPNCVWFGRQSVYKYEEGGAAYLNYYASFHLALCHGKLDEVSAILVDGKEAWSGSATTEIQDIEVDTYPPTGGGGRVLNSSGPGQYFTQDGVDGTAKLRLGGVNPNNGAEAGVSDDIASMMSLTTVPKFYGVASLYVPYPAMVGLSPILRPWVPVCRRIHTMRGGTTQWYDAKAEISIGVNRTDLWKYKVCAAADTTDYSGADYDDSAWDLGRGGISNAPAGSRWYGNPPVRTCIAGEAGTTKTSVPTGTKIWMRLDLGALPVEDLGVRLWHDDVPTLWFNGTQITPTYLTSPNDSSYFNMNAIATIPKALIVEAGPNVIAYRVEDGGWIDSSNAAIYAGIQVGPDTQEPRRVRNQNPAHIIREALTDSIWGDGYQDADIDDVSFTAAADALYSERLGLTFLWDRQCEVKDFIEEIERHIDGKVYVDRATGKFCLKLLRDDYTVGDLLTLDGDNVVSVDSVRRRATAEMVNTVTLTYTGTLKGDASTITVHDAGLLATQGGIVSDNVSFMGITDPSTAARVAARVLRALGSPLLTCEITANREAAGLYPGDAFVLDWNDLDIDATVMRVLEIDIGDVLDNAVKIKACEDVFSLPTVPVVIPAPVYWPPVTLEPPTANSTRFRLCSTRDPLDRGQVVCVYTSTGESALFTGWTETEPGTFVRDVTGPLSDTMFDGVDPEALTTKDEENAISVSWMVGRRVLAWQDVGSSGDPENSGPFIVDDVGGHFENAGTPEEAFVATYAKMHRDPDYSRGSQFATGMTFHVAQGTAFGGKYVTLDNATAIALGETALAWSDAASATWTAGRQLLTDSQLGSVNLLRETALDERTALDGVNCEGFPMLAAMPGLAGVPSGDWSVQLEGAWVTGGDEGAVTTLGFKVWRTPVSGVGGEILFEFRSAALPGAEAPLSVRAPVPSLSTLRSDTLALIPVIRTTSATAVTVHLRYGGPTWASAMTMPGQLGEEVPRSSLEVASFADNTAVVPNRAWSSRVTLDANLEGIEMGDFEDGDVLNLTILGASAGTPRTVVHGATVAAGVGSLFLGSVSGLGVTYPNVTIKASPSRWTFQLDRSNSRWLLVGGPIT